MAGLVETLTKWREHHRKVTTAALATFIWVQAHHNTPLAQTPADAIGFCFLLCCAACSRHEEIEAARARQFALATLKT
jgi:hypothetical protein